MDHSNQIHKFHFDFEATQNQLVSLNFFSESNLTDEPETRSLIISALIDMLNVIKNEPLTITDIDVDIPYHREHPSSSTQ